MQKSTQEPQTDRPVRYASPQLASLIEALLVGRDEQWPERVVVEMVAEPK